MKLKLFHKCTQQSAAFILESRAESHRTSEGAITGPQKCQLPCSSHGWWPNVDKLPHVGLHSASLTTGNGCELGFKRKSTYALTQTSTQPSNTIQVSSMCCGTTEISSLHVCCSPAVACAAWNDCQISPSPKQWLSSHSLATITRDSMPVHRGGSSTCWSGVYGYLE